MIFPKKVADGGKGLQCVDRDRIKANLQKRK